MRKDDKTSLAFIEVYNKIRSKYKFIAIVNIDRVLQHITFEIMKQINMKKPYLLSYNEMIACTEDICNRYTDKYIYIRYIPSSKIK